MKRLVIVGGGISGLAAAHEATRHAASVPGGLEIVVLEAAGEVGGRASTRRVDGWLVEEGPAAYLDSEPAFTELMERAGLANHTIEADPAAARRYIFRDGLREVQPSPLSVARSGILGLGGLARLAAEPLIPRAGETARSTESIWDFAARRLGRQAADRLVAPAVLGVFAGDARELSLTACFPRLAALEREHGGLLRAMLARRRSQPAGGGGSRLISTRKGMQAIPRLLAASSGFITRRGARVEAISRSGAARAADGRDMRARMTASPFLLRIAGDGEPLAAEAIVLAADAGGSASLLEALSPAASAALRRIDMPPLAVVALGYPAPARRAFPVGYGVLIPRGCGYRILGCIWESQLFPDRAPSGRLLVRTMIGGAVDPSAAGLDEADLLALARDEIARLFGVRHAPIFGHVARWSNAIPQYDLEHPRRVECIEAAMSDVPGAFLAGNALHGVAFAKAAVTGVRSGRKAVDWLARS